METQKQKVLINHSKLIIKQLEDKNKILQSNLASNQQLADKLQNQLNSVIGIKRMFKRKWIKAQISTINGLKLQINSTENELIANKAEIKHCEIIIDKAQAKIDAEKAKETSKVAKTEVKVAKTPVKKAPAKKIVAKTKKPATKSKAKTPKTVKQPAKVVKPAGKNSPTVLAKKDLTSKRVSPKQKVKIASTVK